MPSAEKQKRKIVILTGLSGAGMSSALKIMEDLGYEIFDNFPLPFIDELVSQKGYGENPLAIAVDTRSRGFTPADVITKVEELQKLKGAETKLVFMTCSNLALRKRYSETRRSHPLAKDRPALDGIRQERTWLKPLMDSADLLIDTSELSVHDLRRQVESSLHPDTRKRKLTITIMSFGFKNGVPRESDTVIDVRFLANPHWDDALRPKTGKDKAVQAYIEKDPDFKKFIGHIESMMKLLLPRYDDEGKYYFTLAFGCTGGRHRSVYLAEKLSKTIEGWGYNVSTRHRDLD
ncbi:MAG: RNase adapter RapZ [Alphaproteobacteria bacterium]|nr:RNase adapter RapZ [Alphaproteobacteria bacterium]